MKLPAPALLLCTAVILSVTASITQTPSTLEPKTERREGPPLWPSAEAVVDSGTIIDQDFVDRAYLHRPIQWQQREVRISPTAEPTAFSQSRKGTLYIPSGLKGTPGLENVRALDDVVGRIRSEMVRLSRGSVR